MKIDKIWLVFFRYNMLTNVISDAFKVVFLILQKSLNISGENFVPQILI